MKLIRLSNQFLKVIREFAICVKSRMKLVLIAYSWLSIVGLFVTFRAIPPTILLLKLFCAVTGVALGMYLWNDVCDFKQDIISMEILDQSASARPLVKGLVSKNKMGVFSAILVALGLTASALINMEVLLIQLAFLAIYIIYSTEPIRLKRIFLMKQVTVAVGGAIACISAGLAAGTITIQLLYLTGLYVLFVGGANPLADLKDIESDIAGRVKTVANVFGPEFTIRLSLTTFTACAATTWIGYSNLGFNIALPIIGSIVLLAWFYVVYPLLSQLSDLDYVINRIYSRGLPLFFILQIAVLVGSLSF